MVSLAATMLHSTALGGACPTFLMSRELHRRVLQTIERHSMIHPGERVGVGVSGGADSVALLRLLMELKPRLGIELFVLHFHHQLRGADADQDESFAAELSKMFGLEFMADRADVSAQARHEGWNLEDAARRLRYKFFASVAAARGLNRVAVAHTLDDQAETVLAHLLRGTGPAGLAGIHPVAGLMIRPLLDIGREELRNYLSTLGQHWREDPTNQDTSRVRARIRHQLIPLLQRDFEPAAVTRLARLADLAREEELFWRAFEQERFSVLVTPEPAGSYSLAIADLFCPLPALAGQADEPVATNAPWRALSRRLIRRIIFQLRGNRQQLTARHVEDVLHLALKSQSGARIELPGVVVQRVFERIWFSPAEDREQSTDESEPASGKHPRKTAFEYRIERPRGLEEVCVAIPEIGRRISLKIVDCPQAAAQTMPEKDVVDFERLHWPLVLRNWRAGDGYRPLGSRHVRKVGRLLLGARVPLRFRASWPVLASAGELIWTAGFPVAHGFSPGPHANAGLLIAEEEF